MKYLKKFNESKEEEISEDIIKDICFELNDLGFSTKIRQEVGGKISYIRANLADSKKNDQGIYIRQYIDVPWEEVKDVVLRFIDYLGNKFIKLMYSSDSTRNTDKTWGTLTKIDETTEIGRLNMFHIYFKK